MEALELFKIRERMCKHGCKKCPVSYTNNGFQIDCLVFMITYPEEFVQLTEKWGTEHKFKTRKSALKELFPNVEEDMGVPSVCPAIMDCNTFSKINCSDKSCSVCKKNYWEGEYVQN